MKRISFLIIIILTLILSKEISAQNPTFQRKYCDNFEGEYSIVYGERKGMNVQLIDIDSDGKDDLIFSSGDESYSNSGRMYWNQGTNTNPDYQRVFYGGFYSRIAFADFDNDGLADRVCTFNGYYGSHGFQIHSVIVSINQGTVTNSIWVEDEYLTGGDGWAGGLACGDLNGDNLMDVVICNEEEEVKFFINIGTSTDPDFVEDTTIVFNDNLYGGIALIDIDQDGDLDLFALWCQYPAIECYIKFYRNDGTLQQPQFTLVTTNYGGIEEQNVFSITFCDFDYDGDYDLTLDERYYENTGTSSSAIFEYTDDSILSPFPMDLLLKSVFADLDGDADYDFIPCHHDSLSTIQVLSLYENAGTPEVVDWYPAEDTLLAIDNCNEIIDYSFIDMDADGDLDLLLTMDGTSYNSVYYRNIGGAENPVFEFAMSNLWNPTEYLFTVLDADGDGDYDVLNSDLNELQLVENIGTPQNPIFQTASEPYLQTQYSGDELEVYHTCADFDLDGDIDVFVDWRWYDGEGYWLSCDYYLNTGIISNPNWVAIPSYSLYGTLNDLNGCDAYDIDFDGHWDLFPNPFHYKPVLGSELVYYKQTNYWNEIESPVYNNTPIAFTIIAAYPNPFNSSTAITFTLNQSAEVKLAVYDVLGREIQPLVTGHLSLGIHSVVWDASGQASGVYFVRLIVDGGPSAVRKVVLMK